MNDTAATLKELEQKRRAAWRGYALFGLMNLLLLLLLLTRRTGTALLVLALELAYYFLLARPDIKGYAAAFRVGNAAAAMAKHMEKAAYQGRDGIGREVVLAGRLLPIRPKSCLTYHRITGERERMELELSDPAALPAFFPLDGNRKLAVAPFPGKKGESAEKINKSALKNRLDCGRIKGTVILRRKIPGDRMAPAGRSAGSHPLKKLCQEAGIPPEKRQQLVVAADSEGIIWAEGFGADRRCVWREDSRQGCVFAIITTEDRQNGEA